MSRSYAPLSLLLVAVALLLPNAAFALSPVYISSAGTDVNPCTRTAPCLFLQRALSVVDPRGEIRCLDNGPYPFGPIFINKPVLIDCADVRANVHIDEKHLYDALMERVGDKRGTNLSLPK